MADHQFGSDWTDRKIAVLRKYLNAYVVALKKKSFGLIYLDGFSGTGSRVDTSGSGKQNDLQYELLNQPGMEDVKKLKEGSVQVALEAEPPFNKYYFIEQNTPRFQNLEMFVRSDFEDKIDRCSFRNCDANEAILEICGGLGGGERAVFFLDPYGAQVKWQTLEAIAKTEKVDVWYLFPVGLGVTRMLPNNGKVPEKWAKTLDELLGDRDWRDAFYKESPSDLFGYCGGREKSANPGKIIEYFLCRLETIFPGVAKNPLQLRNSKNSLMYVLCFACSNPDPKAYGLALKLANDILTGASKHG